MLLSLALVVMAGNVTSSEERSNESARIQVLVDEVARLKTALYWVCGGFCAVTFLSLNDGSSIASLLTSGGLAIIAGLGDLMSLVLLVMLFLLPFALVIAPLYFVYRFLHFLAARRARINERLAPRKPRRPGRFCFNRIG